MRTYKSILVFNLVDPHKGDVKFKISQFPDGQQDVTIENLKQNSFSHEINPVIVSIWSRFNSFKDLELIICATKALRNMGVKEISLYIPYILGARSDRKFVTGGTSYLRDVIAPILNAQKYINVSCLDAHSDVAPACINKLTIDSNGELLKFALDNISDLIGISTPKFQIISPDAGAAKKIYDLSKHVHIYPYNITICSKQRDPSGKISNTIVPKDDFGGNPVVIIDDICDGGRTFIEISKIIKTRNCKGIYLIVTHGIFSAGLSELKKYFDAIYCTNSVKDILASEDEHALVTQLNAF